MKRYRTTILTKQRGVALVTVLFMFAVAVVVVTDIIRRVNINLQSSASVFEMEQAYMLCLSGEEWARQLLAKDAEDDESAIDHQFESWAAKREAFEVEGGYIEIDITDLHSKFNLNNILESGNKIDGNSVKALQRLMMAYDVDSDIGRTVSVELSDWLDEESIKGVEEMDYLAEEPSYRAANTTITHPSELRLLKNLEQEDYQIIRDELFPYLTALPTRTRYNVNTMSAELLASLHEQVNLDQATAAISEVENRQGFESVEEFLSLLPKNTLTADELTVSSEYFEVRVRAKFGDQYAYLVTAVHRSEEEGELTLISRDRGQRFIFTHSKDYNANAEEESDYEIEL